jgi:hypothetical protein
VTPWICSTEANGLGRPLDDQCNAPTKVEYVYRSTDPSKKGFQPYDPAHPPADVSPTTTDRGLTVPYVVRVETSTMDRGITKTTVLADPAKPWKPWAPQKAWNGKLMVPFGGNCAAKHAQTTPAGAYVGGVLDETALSRGFAVTESGLNQLGNNCNEVVSAEVLMMQKERIAETLGPIRYAIGEGCSGGAIQQYNIAGAYPGLLDGITPACSFADIWTTGAEVFDCGLLHRYFTETSPALWPATAQRTSVEGHAPTSASCAAWTALFLPAFDPTGDGPLGTGTAVIDNGCALPADQRYSRTANPKGARCDVASYGRAVLGTRASDGFAKRPVDNVGIQYGLGALRSGQISAEQFVDLNRRIGGFDIDLAPQAQRTEADPGVIATAYRSGRVTDGRALAAVPIIDVRPHNNEEIHQSYYSYTVRARLERANGTHDNQAIWTVPTTATAPTTAGAFDDPILASAFLTMDRWLARIEADRSRRPRAEKVIANRPDDAVDSCWVWDRQVTDAGTCRAAYPYYANPRIAAGGPMSNDVLKCALKPLERGDYGVAFTDPQWAQLKEAFASGVCDWRKAGADQQRSVPWMSFAAGPGGRPLGRAPRSTALRCKGKCGRR